MKRNYETTKRTEPNRTEQKRNETKWNPIEINLEENTK